MATDSGVKVFATVYSPFAQRVVIALREKGIDFELNNVDLTNKPKELLEANPIHGKIPALVHNGQAVAESLVILQYIEDAWPQQVPLLPGDAYEKSQMLFWADYIYQLFTKLFPNFLAKPGSPERAAGSTAAIEGLKTLEKAMVGFSAGGPFFAGEKFGYVDVVLAPIAVMLYAQERMCELSVPGTDELPRFHKWLAAVWEHPSVKETLPKKESIVPYLQAMMERRRTANAARPTANVH